MTTHEAALPPTVGARAYQTVELIEGRLYQAGGMLPMDGTASWAPESASGFQSTNTYCLIGDDSRETLIVDPGLACVRESVLQALDAVVPTGVTPRVFITRAGFDCVGNLGAVCAAFAVPVIFTGGLANPFDSFDVATSFGSHGRAALRVVERSPAESRLEIHNPPLRLLSTFWGYDAASRTLFTSDSFTHVTVADQAAPPVVRSPAQDTTSVEDVREHLYGTFWWLRYASSGAIADGLREFFDARPVDVIAPGRGCVLAHPQVVERHIAMVLDVLAEPPEKS